MTDFVSEPTPTRFSWNQLRSLIEEAAIGTADEDRNRGTRFTRFADRARKADEVRTLREASEEQLADMGINRDTVPHLVYRGRVYL